MGAERCVIVGDGLRVTLQQFRKQRAQGTRCPGDVGLRHIRPKSPARYGEAT